MTIKSVLLAIAGTSAVGGVAAGGYFFMQPKNIKDLLIKDKLTSLDTSESSTKDDDKWDKLVLKHNDKTENNKDKVNGKIERLKFEGIQEPIDKAKLKKACRDLFEKPIPDNPEEDKKNGKNWCTSESPLLDDSAKG